MLDPTLLRIREFAATRRLVDACRVIAAPDHFAVRGVSGSLDAFLLVTLADETGRPLLVVTRDLEKAVRITDDLKTISGPSAAFHFASAPHRADTPAFEVSRRIEDVECLRAMVSGKVPIVTTHHEALRTMLPSPAVLKGRLLSVRTGDEHTLNLLIERLEESGFTRKNFIESVGDYSVRGGILDLFPYVGENPVRIEFNGDTIESIREFDPLSQRSIRELSAASLIPDLLSEASGFVRESSLFDFLFDGVVVVICDPEPGGSDPSREEWWSGEVTQERMGRQARIDISGVAAGGSDIDFGSRPQPAFNGSIRVLRNYLTEEVSGKGRVDFCCEGESELARLRDLLLDIDASPEGTDPVPDRIHFVGNSPHEGFVVPAERLAVLTEHQVFARRKRIGRRRTATKRKMSDRELQQLRKHDFVVHADYGIGRFAGLETITVQRIHHDVLRIHYDGGDVLSVNLNYINRVRKYSSSEGHVPKLSRLGTPEWQKLKSRAKGKIKDIARDLMRLYAERRRTEGIAYQPDTPWQRELEASFIFEDTPDQAKATVEVKSDMEAPFPMDRLICGDVGFGKTEVAIRAAFKAVMDGKQVAVLVPTTILALQHHNTFADRLGRYSVVIDVISRLKSKAEQASVLERIRTGKADVVIGTHRLLSRDVSFNNLGLLIVDEEHRFGVAAKEKLRQRKTNVDTLTLTATPIPRTLHFSLMGARDLSIIATPPQNRLPIITEIVQLNDEIVRDALRREIHRGGQVYVVHDRIHDITEFAGRLHRIVPEIRIDYAHGQMPPKDLEQVMLMFLERKLDVLVCTKIIESGLDIPNVNTIIINRADRFGMAELYQLRGRVGRSNVQAFAFLLAPPLASLPAESLKRLLAMQEFTELGSGFNLAMRDLEIRGAGNLLGSEQSGFIAEMGFETYTRILEEAVAELREEEFDGMGATPVPVRPENTLIEADVDALIPISYVNDNDARLEIYRRLYAMTGREEVLEIGEELRDRFGEPPAEVRALLDVLTLRLSASVLGCRKVRITRDLLEIEVHPDPERWNDETAATFVGAIRAIEGRLVSLVETADGFLLRVPLPGRGEFLPEAEEGLRSVAPALSSLKRSTDLQDNPR